MARTLVAMAALVALTVGAAAQSYEQDRSRAGLERSERSLERRSFERELDARDRDRRVRQRTERLRLERQIRQRPLFPSRGGLGRDR